MAATIKSEQPFVLKAREELELTQRGMAKLMKVSQSSVFRYEQGSTVPLRTATRLLEIFEGKYTFDDIYNPFMHRNGKEDTLLRRKSRSRL